MMRAPRWRLLFLSMEEKHLPEQAAFLQLKLLRGVLHESKEGQFQISPVRNGQSSSEEKVHCDGPGSR